MAIVFGFGEQKIMQCLVYIFCAWFFKDFVKILQMGSKVNKAFILICENTADGGSILVYFA